MAAHGTNGWVNPPDTRIRLAIFVVVYALSPFDLIPGFIPVLGYLDDGILLPGLIWLAPRSAGPWLTHG